MIEIPASRRLRVLLSIPVWQPAWRRRQFNEVTVKLYLERASYNVTVKRATGAAAMKQIGDGSKGCGYFTGLGIAQQFANAVCHFLRNHNLAKPHAGGGVELPIDQGVWRDVLRTEYNPEAIKNAQSLQAYCDYYNGGRWGHGYDLDGIWDSGTGNRRERHGKSIRNPANRANTVHPGTKAPFLNPMQVVALVRKHLPEIPRNEGRHAAMRLKPQRHKIEKAGEFDPKNELDARQRIDAAIIRRYGREQYRANLLNAYGGRCAVTGCNALAALDAAHIKPYKGPHSDFVSNGLVLRGDIHTLFDLNFIGIHPDSLQVRLAPSLSVSSYKKYNGRVIRTPKKECWQPDRERQQDSC